MKGREGSKVEGERSKVKGREGEGGEGQRTEGGGGRSVELEFYCQTPGLEGEPVVLKVFYGGRVLDEVVFSGRPKKEKETVGQVVRREYELPVVGGDDELVLEVSRTWIPHEVLGNFDRRRLGVGVKELSSKVKDLR